jgi:outer membrane protein OmpA-like peptidoglycan-associated protein
LRAGKEVFMKKIGRKMVVGLVFLFLLTSNISFAQEDKEGCKDHPLLTRMENFFIDHCKEEKFDEVDFRDEKGKKIKVEGKVYKIDYQIKEGFTPPSGLQVIRNYENAIKRIGGVKIYQEDQYEIWLKLDKGGKTFWVYVDSWHGGGKGETYGITIVEKETMAQEVVADAKSLMSDIQAKGSASVYGIYFDFDKADIKPESEPAIKEIAKLLQENKGLKIYVVGHTDNVGTIDYNMKLSKARADAVMNELVTKYNISSERLKAYGVGSLAPVASNKTDDGRAKNRRVELVEQ